MPSTTQLSTRRRVCAATLVLALCLAPATQAAADGFAPSPLQLNLGADGVSLNPQLRGDLGPVTSGVQPLRHFSLGYARKKELVSAVNPIEVSRERLERMPLSRTFWTAGGPLELNWEVIFENPTFNGLPPWLSVGPYTEGVTGYIGTQATIGPKGITEPVGRRYLYYLFQVLNARSFGKGIAFLSDALEVRIEWCRNSSTRTTEEYYHAMPTQFDQLCNWGLVEEGVTCSIYNVEDSYLPFTMLGCETESPRHDATIRLDVVETRNLVSPWLQNGQRPISLGPTIMVVDQERVLVRPLRFEDEECHEYPYGDGVGCTQADWDQIDQLRECGGAWTMPKFGGGKTYYQDPCLHPGGFVNTLYQAPVDEKRLQAVWTFSVDVDADGRWAENFSDKVHVDYVKLFTEDERGQRRYIRPSEMRPLGLGDFDCVAETEAGTGDAIIRIREDYAGNVSCDRSGHAVDVIATPAWELTDLENDNLSAPLEWTVKLTTYSEYLVFTRDLPVLEGDRFFIEFHLAAEGYYTDSNPMIPSCGMAPSGVMIPCSDPPITGGG